MNKTTLLASFVVTSALVLFGLVQVAPAAVEVHCETNPTQQVCLDLVK